MLCVDEKKDIVRDPRRRESEDSERVLSLQLALHWANVALEKLSPMKADAGESGDGGTARG